MHRHRLGRRHHRRQHGLVPAGDAATVTVVDRQGHAALETNFGNGAQISVFLRTFANAGAP